MNRADKRSSACSYNSFRSKGNTCGNLYTNIIPAPQIQISQARYCNQLPPLRTSISECMQVHLKVSNKKRANDVPGFVLLENYHIFCAFPSDLQKSLSLIGNDLLHIRLTREPACTRPSLRWKRMHENSCLISRAPRLRHRNYNA